MLHYFSPYRFLTHLVMSDDKCLLKRRVKDKNNLKFMESKSRFQSLFVLINQFHTLIHTHVRD